MDTILLYTNFSLVALLLVLVVTVFLKKLAQKPSRKVFLLDFACYKGKQSEVYTKEIAMSLCKRYNCSSTDTLEFVSKVLDRAGISNMAYAPPAVVSESLMNPCLDAARKEAEDVLFGTVDDVLEKSGAKCEEIGIIVVNCSLFNVVPSLADMIVSKYKLREGVLCYNLTGMGCSAGLAAIGFANQLLQVHPNTYALVVSTENITENYYMGKNRYMMLANGVFRLGGAAILLSNRPSDHHVSKYQLIHAINNTTASHDLSYKCIFVEEDEEGKLGLTINKDLLIAATKVIRANVATLVRVSLPLSEQIKLIISRFVVRHIHKAKIKSFVQLLNIGDRFDHFFPHVGGKPVLDELQKTLGFSDVQMEASRMTLYRFGNTSSSSIWYALAYGEAKGRINSGDRLWQISYGSGFKCNSVIWRALRTVDAADEKNPWRVEIDAFPVDVSKIEAPHVHFESSEQKE